MKLIPTILLISGSLQLAGAQAADAPSSADSLRKEIKLLNVITEESLGPLVEVDHLVAQAQEDGDQLRRQLEQTRRQVEQSRRQIEDHQRKFRFEYNRPAAPSPFLVVRSPKSDLKNLPELQEDLSILHRILQKAAGPETSGDSRQAMGIVINPSSPLAKPNAYLEGYGVLMFLNASIPLLEPKDKAKKTENEEKEDSEWERTRKEIYAPRPAPQPVQSFDGHGGTIYSVNAIGFINAGGARYEKERVDKLRDSVLEGLKNARHIKQLRNDDLLIVAIKGQSTGEPEMVKIKDGLDVDKLMQNLHPGGTMVIRVKKSDADAFASGKLNLEQFREKASVHID